MGGDGRYEQQCPDPVRLGVGTEALEGSQRGSQFDASGSLVADRAVVSDQQGDLWILTSTPTSGIAFAEITAAQLHAAFTERRRSQGLAPKEPRAT